MSCLFEKQNARGQGSQGSVQVKIAGWNVGAIEKADAATYSARATSCGLSTTDASFDPMDTDRMSKTNIADTCNSTEII